MCTPISTKPPSVIDDAGTCVQRDAGKAPDTDGAADPRICELVELEQRADRHADHVAERSVPMRASSQIRPPSCVVHLLAPERAADRTEQLVLADADHGRVAAERRIPGRRLAAGRGDRAEPEVEPVEIPRRTQNLPRAQRRPRPRVWRGLGRDERCRIGTGRAIVLRTRETPAPLGTANPQSLVVIAAHLEPRILIISGVNRAGSPGASFALPGPSGP